MKCGGSISRNYNIRRDLLEFDLNDNTGKRCTTGSTNTKLDRGEKGRPNLLGGFGNNKGSNFEDDFRRTEGTNLSITIFLGYDRDATTSREEKVDKIGLYDAVSQVIEESR
jgi:hypothetical protein